MPTFTGTAANETITPPNVSAGSSVDGNSVFRLLLSRGSEREMGVMTWWRWLPAAAGLALLSLCLPPSGTLWAQETPLKEIPFDRKLVASAGVAPDGFGSSLAVSGDTLVVAAPRAAVDDKLFVGAAYVFVRGPASGGWVERKRLVAQDGARFPSSVAIDGDTVVLGFPYATVDGIARGAAYVFERHAGGVDNWGQVAKLTDDSIGLLDQFGSSIAIEGDLLAIGASGGGASSKDSGQVTLFERDRGGPGAWGKIATIRDSDVGDGGTLYESFGSAVALAGDLLLVGAATADVSFDDENDGAAYLFRRNGVDRDHWDLVARLTAAEATLCPGGRTLAEISLESLEVRREVEHCAKTKDSRTDRDAFGTAVALEGDTIVVGAPSAEAVTGRVIGAAYVFRRDPSEVDRWEQIAKLTGSDILASTSIWSDFGRVLALAGDTLLVGVIEVNVGSHPYQGAAYLFERGAGGPDTWGEVAKLVAGDGLSFENFGVAVALDGSNGIIGASGYSLGQGAVYLAGDPPPEKPPEPAFPPTGQLVNDGIVEGAGDVLLGAFGTTLAEPLPVWIVEVPPPAEPLPFMMRPIGAFYNVGASRTTWPPGDVPFGLALPVPAGADTAHLGVAVFSPVGRRLKGGGDPGIPVPGFYNPETNLFSFALSTLFVEGSTVVLVEDPDLAPLSEAVVAPRSTRHGPQDEPVPQFDILCLKFTDINKCTEADKGKMNRLLQAAHDEYLTTLEYKKPFLSDNSYKSTSGNGLTGVFLLQYTRVIANELGRFPCDEKKLGEYLPNPFPPNEMPVMRICYSRETPEDLLNATIRHEIFHSFQYSKDYRLREGGVLPLNFKHEQIENFKWIQEGTATAAEASSKDTMSRSRFNVPPLHPINRALVASDEYGLNSSVPTVPPTSIQYSAQDFWVYFGNKHGLGLGYLKELFTRGASPEAADAFFQEVYGTSLDSEYWAWVKNQAIEKTIDFGGLVRGGLVGPCSIEVSPWIATPTGVTRTLTRDDVVTGRPLPPPGNEVPPPGPVPWRPRPAQFSQNADPPFVMGILDRLTANVVEIGITGNLGRTKVTINPQATLQPEGRLAYKIYLNGDPSCAAQDDKHPENKERTFENLKDGDTIYVVLANTQNKSGSRVEYTVNVERVP